MAKKKDLTGKVFGRLRVIKEVLPSTIRRVQWLCLCECGNIIKPSTDNLLSKNTRSCGCLRIEHGQSCHGKMTKEYKMWSGAKLRAKAEGTFFNLELADIVIPEFCPVLPNIKINADNRLCRQDDSPSIDKLIPTLGYVKGNVNIISWRANEIKRDATVQELTQVLAWLNLELEKKEALC